MYKVRPPVASWFTYPSAYSSIPHNTVNQAISTIKHSLVDWWRTRDLYIFRPPSLLGILITHNVGKTTINHPPIHHFYRSCTPFPVMGGVWHWFSHSREPCWWREVPLYVSRVARAFIEVGKGFRSHDGKRGKMGSFINQNGGETMENSGFKHQRWEF